jgi:hypothetical protein
MCGRHWTALPGSARRPKVQWKNQKALLDLQKIVGRLGNRFGEFAEATLVPDLKKQFKKYGFTFDKLSENIQVDNDEHDLHAEIDAFLENGVEAMVVEVKVNLKTADVDEHIRRMEKVRKHADMHNDKRKFFGAIAAAVIAKDIKTYALKQGFYIVEPSGENVKIIPPVTQARFW